MSTLDSAFEAFAKGKMVILVDDEDRENEGDLVFPAESVTAEKINFMAMNGRGLICLALDSQRVDELKIPMMTSHNRSARSTAFTVSIEARTGISTGISAHDRAHTVRTAIDPLTTSDDLISPGHVFPLKAVEGGVLVRSGHTEGSTDLVRIAGYRPAAVICEIMKDDGTMARLPDLVEFAKKHDLTIISIKDVIAHRMEREQLIEKVAVSKIPSGFAMDPKRNEFEVHAFKSLIDGTEHLALVYGDIQSPTLVRVHSECLTGDALGSLRCDCGLQLQGAMKQITQNGSGILVYMRRHEGRGIGLGNKIKAYALQDQGMDTVEANRHLGFQPDLRHYGLGAQILKQLGVTDIHLLTNNPKKVVGLEGYGLKIVERIPIETSVNSHNLAYLKTKREKLGHEINI
jgi:3,4-dihydroxy 2-butanone 4-phosphate synthase/GTP cyclohydrolase II